MATKLAEGREPIHKGTWEQLEIAIKNSDGFTFKSFCSSSFSERQKLALIVEKKMSPDPARVQADTEEAYGYLGYANNRVADANTFYDTAKALGVDKLECEGRSTSSAEVAVKAHIARFNEERNKWAAIADSLLQRVYHGRKEEDRSRGEHNATR